MADSRRNSARRFKGSTKHNPNLTGNVVRQRAKASRRAAARRAKAAKKAASVASIGRTEAMIKESGNNE